MAFTVVLLEMIIGFSINVFYHTPDAVLVVTYPWLLQWMARGSFAFSISRSTLINAYELVILATHIHWWPVSLYLLDHGERQGHRTIAFRWVKEPVHFAISFSARPAASKHTHIQASLVSLLLHAINPFQWFFLQYDEISSEENWKKKMKIDEICSIVVVILQKRVN